MGCLACIFWPSDSLQDDTRASVTETGVDGGCTVCIDQPSKDALRQPILALPASLWGKAAAYDWL